MILAKSFGFVPNLEFSELTGNSATINSKSFGQGGRLRRSAVGVMTFAPALAMKLISSISTLGVGAVATSTILAGEVIAQSGSCAWTNNNNRWECTGSRQLTGGVTAHRTSNSTNLEIILSSGTTWNLSSGTAFDLRNSGTNGGIVFTQAAGGNDIVGGASGIDARGRNGGTITVTVTGKLEGENGHGLLVTSYSTNRGGNIDISITDVKGKQHGLYAKTGVLNGTITITATGLIESTDQFRYALTASAYRSGSVSINANNVSGSGGAVRIRRFGSGTLTATFSGTVSTSRAWNDGVNVYISGSNNDGTGSNTITLNNVSGGSDGIYINDRDSRALSLTVTGTVSGRRHYGISIRKYNGTTSTTITVSAVQGGTGGIAFRELQGGSNSKGVTISATGHVHGRYSTIGDGIFAQKTGSGDVKIDTKDVTGGREGIWVFKQDSGSVDIMVSGDVVGNCGAANSGADCISWDDAGIYAYTDKDAGDIEIEVTTAGSVSGSHGIYAKHYGEGKVTITATGEVDGNGNRGIYVYSIGGDNIDDEPGINITADDVDASKDGIYVNNDSRGEGGVKITVNESGTVYGEDAIYVANYDKGDIEIVVGVNAKVSSDLNLGIGAAQDRRGGNITITSSAGSMISSYTRSGAGLARGHDAIYLFQGSGGGTISVNLSGNVKATGHGIKVKNDANTVTTITSNGDISGGTAGSHGIYVNNTVGGQVNVTVSGDITGGGTRNAIRIPAGTRISKDYYIATWTGRRYFGSREFTLEIRPTPITRVTNVPEIVIPARVGYALNLNSVASGGTGNVTVTINGGTISASTGFQSDSGGGAILNGAGNSRITFNSGSILNGKVSLGGGQDTLDFNGGKLTATSILDGGPHTGTSSASVDIIRFRGGATTQNNNALTIDPANIRNFERVNIEAGTVWRMNGNITLSTIPRLIIGGTLSMQDAGTGAADDRITISNRLQRLTGATATIAVDVDFVNGTSDVLNISSTGNALGSTFVISIRDITANSSSARTANEITVVTTNGNTVVTNAISLAGGTTFTSGGVQFSLESRLDSNQNLSSFVLVASTTLEDCSEGNSGVFTCSGTIDVSENMIKGGSTAISATLQATATVNVVRGIALKMQGGGDISFVQQSGGGTISATSSDSRGVVHAESSGQNASANVSVTLVGTAALEGNGKAIYVRNRGTGTITVNAPNVTASHSGATGIEIISNGQSSTVTAGTISAGKTGIKAYVNRNTGMVSVTATGLITVGSNGLGVDVTTKTGDITIATSGITMGAGGRGIKATALGTGDISITNSGNISLRIGVGIDTYTKGGSTTITLNGGNIRPSSSGDSVSIAIRNDEGNSTIVVNDGASIGAHVHLGMGTDTLTFSGGSLYQSGTQLTLDGGPDQVGSAWTDVLNFSGNISTPALNASKIMNWEQINVSSGSTVKFNGAHSLETNQLNLLGTLDLQDDLAGDALTITGNLIGGGTVLIDVNFSTGTADVLNVGGNVTGTYVITIEDETPSDQTSRTQDPINIVSVTGRVAAGAFSLGNVSTIDSGNTFYSLQFNASTKTYFLEGISRPLRCVESSTAGEFTCSGAISATENIFKLTSVAFDVTLDDAATVNVSNGVAFNIQGTQGITFVQEAGGRPVNATGTATGVVRAKTTGSGDVSVTLTGSASLTGSGIAIEASTTETGNVTVNAGNVTATNQSAFAIKAVASGGNIVVTSSGAVSGGSYGVYARNRGTSGSITITLGSIGSGSGYGVYARNDGSGGVTVSVGSVNSLEDGIDVFNASSGDVLINVGGSITSGPANTADAISVVDEGTGGVTVNAGAAITGADDGIDVLNEGGGSIAITASGTISAGGDGRGDAGIFAQNDSDGDGITILAENAITVSGEYGIYVYNEGSGAVTVRNSGDIIGKGDQGLYIYQAGTTVSATVRRVEGDDDGIRLRHYGSGSATITIVQGGSISAENKAIHATGSGSGDIILVASGAITGDTEQGVYAYQSGNGNLSVSVEAVGGDEEGIEAKNFGSGNLTITATGAITAGRLHDGVLAYDDSSGGVTVTVSSVTGGDDGIQIINKSGGDTSATINGDVVSTGSSSANVGLDIFSDNEGGAITVNVMSGANITGVNAVVIEHEGSGDVTFNSSGSINGRSGGRNGIDITSHGGNIDLTISGNVYGRENGIEITNSGSGSTKITINSGAVRSSGGVSIIQNGGPSTVTIGNGVILNGTVNLGDGVDILRFSGATSFTSTTATRNFDGGSDTGTDTSKDVVSFVGISGALNFTRFHNWEVLELGAGTSMSISSSRTLNFEEVRLSGGTIDLSDNVADDVLTISGNLTSGGGFVLDTNVSSGDTDSITITGNLSGQHVVSVNNITPSNATTYSASITVATITGTASAGAMVLRNTPRFGAKIFRLQYNTTAKTFNLVAVDGNLLCVENDNTAGTFVCAGTINNSENMVVDPGTNIVATLSAGATVNISAFVAFNLEGEGGISFIQGASGNAITGTSSSLGLIQANSRGSGDHDVVITVNGDANFAGSGTAIKAMASGTGDITITTGKVSASGSGGMTIEAMGKGGSVSVVTNDVIVGGKGAIMAKNTSATGTVTVTAGSTVTTTTGTAIHAYGMGASVAVNATAAVTGGVGIQAVNKSSGAGTVAVTASAAVTASTGDGIYAYNKGTGGLTITANSTVAAKVFGIHAINHTSGDLSINAASSVTGEAGSDKDGIGATDTGEGSITVVAAAVTGDDDGIDADNAGGGSVTVTVSGNILGLDGFDGGTREGAGVTIENDASGTDSTLTVRGAAQIKGGYGVYIKHQASGAVQVTSNDEFEGTVADGIYVLNEGTTTNITVDTVLGEKRGINLKHKGSGDVTIVSSGSITGTTSGGIEVEQTATSNVSVTVAAVTGGNDGIRVKTGYSGNVTINATGAVSGSDSKGDGVYVRQSGAGNISITTLAVTGTDRGIDARNYTGGSITVTANGAVSATATGAKDAGISTYDDVNGGVILVTLGSSGSAQGNYGIYSYSKGSGNVTINASGAVTGIGKTGVHVNKLNSGHIVISVDDVTGAGHGVSVNNVGFGLASLTVNGDVTASGDLAGHGIMISGGTNAGNISVDLKTGSTVTGKVAGVALSSSSAGDIAVTSSAAITGGTDGIRVMSEGTGDISLTLSGNVVAGSEGIGIDTKVSTGTATIVLHSGTIGGKTSIKNNNGASVITVNAGTEISGDIMLGGGIDTLTFAGTNFNSAITIDGGEDVGADSSIDVLNLNAGTVSADASKLVNWERIVVARGVTLSFGGGTQSLVTNTISLAGTLSLQDTAANDALTVRGNIVGGSSSDDNKVIAVDINLSTGDTDTLTIRGNLTGTNTLNVADVSPANNRTRVTTPITVVTVTGTVASNALALPGGRLLSRGYIYELRFDATAKTFILDGKRGTLLCASSTTVVGQFACAGALTTPENITASGTESVSATLASSATVRVTDDIAFRVSSQSSTTFTQASGGAALNAVDQAYGVILATSSGGGAVSVTLTGTASLEGSGTAIEASSTGTGDVTVVATSVQASHAAGTGIKAEGRGAAVSVRASTVSGGGAGIIARNVGTTAGSVSVNVTGAISSSGTAITAYNRSGSVTVNAGATVTATAVGIMATNSGGIGNVSIVTGGAVTSSGSGIRAHNMGSGTVTVNAGGAVSGSGTTGIEVMAGTTAGDVTVTAVAVSGQQTAIKVDHARDGAITVTANGAVTSEQSSGIAIEGIGTGAISVVANANVTGGSQGAAIDIIAHGSATSVTLNSGVTISAASGVAIRTNDFNSSVTVNSGATVSGSIFMGGGVDTLTFANASFGDSVLDGGTDGGDADSSVDVLTINGGSFALVDGKLLNWESLVIGAQATATVEGNRTLIVDDITLQGAFSMQDRVANDSLTVTGDIAGGGMLKIDVDFYIGTADRLVVNGAVTGSTTIDVSDVSLRAGGNEEDTIVIATVNGESSATSFNLVNNGFTAGEYQYTLTFNSENNTYSLGRKESVGSVMLVAAPIALFDGFARLPTMQERRASGEFGQRGWSRLISNKNTYGDAPAGRAEYETQNTGLQVGFELAEQVGPSGTWVYGVTAQYNKVDGDVKAVTTEGTLTAEGYGIGGTATWYGAAGAYVDVQAQYNLISTDFTVGDNVGALIDGEDSSSMVIGVEIGKRHEINDKFSVLSSGQMSWGRVDVGDFVTANSQPVKFGGDDDGISARFGVQVDYAYNNQYQGYVLTNLHYDTYDSWDITFVNSKYEDSVAPVMAELGLGGSAELSPEATIYLQAGYKKSFGKEFEERDSTSITAGVRWSW